jgi:uncharacterized phiE125 gp8 family phage protein
MREILPPTQEPLTLEEVRVHLRQHGDSFGDSPGYIEPYDDDSWVSAKITAARQWAEDFLGFPLTDAVYVESLDAFEEVIPLPEGGADLAGIDYLDEDNIVSLLSTSAYEFDEHNLNIYIDPNWPSTSTRAGAVRIRYHGAYGPPPRKPVPESIKHAMLLLIADAYENRGGIWGEEKGFDTTLMQRLEDWIRPSRIRLGMA